MFFKLKKSYCDIEGNAIDANSGGCCSTADCNFWTDSMNDSGYCKIFSEDKADGDCVNTGFCYVSKNIKNTKNKIYRVFW
jgi:hypothetical protein